MQNDAAAAAPPLPQPQHAVAPPFRPFGAKLESWTEWSRQFGFHLAAYRIQGNDRQPFLLAAVGVQTYRVIVKLFPRRDVATLSYEEILSALDAYFKESINVVAKRYTFFRTKRTAGQTNREWVATLQGLTRDCAFECECGLPYSDTMVRDAIAQNVSDVRIREQILKLVNPSLQQVMDILDRQDTLDFAQESFATSPPVCQVNRLARRAGCAKNYKAHLELKVNAQSKFFRARNVPHALRDEVAKTLHDLESQGVIERVQASLWASHLVILQKPSGKLRLCVDFKATVNPQLVTATFPLPRPEDLFDKVCPGKYFSKLDLADEYLQNTGGRRIPARFGG
ncbi:uncharacterized protein LOC126471400 [Schistocerca serialis cubense]|uniref:uncharacterized protein LOC126471400 n=1 Tax=Schistocerca serialis cubense TaxID=2023355 RepID=UPI00214E9A9D|nr:uncharacterized protein LOC126471400 [Schistocerca serialis cubense]